MRSVPWIYIARRVQSFVARTLVGGWVSTAVGSLYVIVYIAGHHLTHREIRALYLTLKTEAIHKTTGGPLMKGIGTNANHDQNQRINLWDPIRSVIYLSFCAVDIISCSRLRR